jgi:amidohydrolase
MTDLKLKNYRRDLHQIPELAFDLFLTSAYIKKELESMGYQTISTAKTGLIAIKEGKSNDAIAFRSDMDALPVTELTNASFLSKHEGKMHACGHDGHMSMLLGFAEYVSKMKDINQTIVFIFQPAEEGPGGAKVIIEEGVFEKLNIKKIFGIHLYPGLDEGLYGLVNGPMMAQNGEFNIQIHGKSAHGAQPHLGNDAILASSHLVSSYHSIISRFIDPLDPAVITIGTIHGGEARNIIAQDIYLTGTIRSFNQDVYDTIKRKMRDIDSGISKAFDVVVTNDIIDYYPPVVNDQNLFHMLEKDMSKKEYRILKPMMFAEDFAFYQQKVPGMFVMLGTKNDEKGYVHPLHSCYFNFDEKVLIRGVELYKRISKLLEIF